MATGEILINDDDDDDDDGGDGGGDDECYRQTSPTRTGQVKRNNETLTRTRRKPTGSQLRYGFFFFFFSSSSSSSSSSSFRLA